MRSAAGRRRPVDEWGASDVCPHLPIVAGTRTRPLSSAALIDERTNPTPASAIGDRSGPASSGSSGEAGALQKE